MTIEDKIDELGTAIIDMVDRKVVNKLGDYYTKAETEGLVDDTLQDLTGVLGGDPGESSDLGFALNDLSNLNEDGIEIIKQNSYSGFNLFDIVEKDHILQGNEAKGYALLGSYVYKDSAPNRYGYPDFYNKCIEEYGASTSETVTLGGSEITIYTNSNGHQFFDIADKSIVDNFYTTMGSAWYYGIDTENERIFLPRLDKKELLSVNSTTSVVGNGKTLGLTNGSTNVGLVQPGDDYIFRTDSYGKTLPYNTSVLNGVTGLSLKNSVGVTRDAANSGLVANIGEAIRVAEDLPRYYYMVVGNTDVTESLTDIIEIATTENDTMPLYHNFYSTEDMTTNGVYVNASLGAYLSGEIYTSVYNDLVSKIGQAFCAGTIKEYGDSSITDYDVVVNQADIAFRLPLLNGQRVLVAKKEATSSDLRWYNWYSDGYLEQGGQCSGTTTSITLPIAYKNTSYFVSSTCTVTGNTGQNGRNYIVSNRTTTTFYCSMGYANTSTIAGFWDGNNIWSSSGFGAIPQLSDFTTDTALYFKLSNTLQNQAILDVAGITSQLNEQNSVSRSYLVENYENGNSGYRVYSDGWCEQWGKHNGNGTYSTMFITLLKPYKDANYKITSYIDWSVSNNTWYTNTSGSVAAAAMTDIIGCPAGQIATGFYIQSFTRKYWKTEGYIA